MPGGGFEQCYNALVVVDTETMQVMVPEVTKADTSYYSQANVADCHRAETSR